MIIGLRYFCGCTIDIGKETCLKMLKPHWPMLNRDNRAYYPTVSLRNSWRVKTTCSTVSLSLGQNIFLMLLKGWRTAIMHLKREKKYCENVLLPAGEGRAAVAHNRPNVQFWDKKLEGRLGAALLLSSGLRRHVVIIWTSFECTASFWMKRAVVQDEN